MTRLPTVFVSHGAPTLALQPGKTGAALAQLGRALPRPRAILMVSAHWNTPSPMVSGATQPALIYDFHGFPAELYRLQYPARGAPELGQHVRQILNTANFATAIDPQRGLDHGAWVPLRLMYPDADVPVTQLSVQPSQPAAYHYRLGRALASLRTEGVLLVGSGSFTHNLLEIGRYAPEAPTESYVTEFTEWMATHIHAGDIDTLLRYRELAPHAQRAHPTEEHLLPLFVALGAAEGEPESLRLAGGGTTFGVLAMDTFVLGTGSVQLTPR